MFTNGDFELVAPDGGPLNWTYNASFVQSQPFGFGGSLCAQVRAKHPIAIGDGGVEQEVAVVPGAQVTLNYWLDAFASTLGDLHVEWSEDGGGSWNPIRVVNYSEIVGVGAQSYVDTFTPTASPIRIHWQTASGTTSSYWWLDDVSGASEVADIMAVLLGEFAVPAMLKMLQARLAAEVTAINAERNDAAVQLTNVQRWYCYARDAASPDLNECEVFINAGGISWPRFPSQLSRWSAGAVRTSLDSSVALTVVINHANRGGVAGTTLKPSEMWKLNQRYGAALMRALRNYPNLEYDAILCTPSQLRLDVRPTGSEDPRVYGRVELDVVVDLQETATGENVAGGGVPPVAVLES